MQRVAAPFDEAVLDGIRAQLAQMQLDGTASDPIAQQRRRFALLVGLGRRPEDDDVPPAPPQPCTDCRGTGTAALAAAPSRPGRRLTSVEHRMVIASHHGHDSPALAEWTPELGRQVVAWRAVCTCGWQGAPVFRDTTDRRSRAWSDDGWPPAFVEGHAEGQWERHVDDGHAAVTYRADVHDLPGRAVS
ncbi:hypothetical protein [Thalassiella azotivora]